MNLFIARRYLKFKPFDVSSEEGRSHERYRLALLAIIANVVSRGLAMLVMLFAVSLTISYLGAERFGVWMTISSFAGILLFLDLGVGNALTNRVAEAAASQDSIAIRRVISGGLGFLFLLSCLIVIVLFGIVNFVPWDSFIKVKDTLLYVEIRQSAFVFSGLFGMYLFANGLQRIFSGLQRTYEGHIVSSLGSIFTLVSLLIAAHNKVGIPSLLFITIGIQSFASFCLIIVLIDREQFSCENLIENIKKEARHLLQIGGLFLILQIGVMIGWGADSLIISSSLGAEKVAMFAITQRLFQFATQPMGMLNAPLWAAYADANVRGDNSFIKKTLNKSMVTTACYTILAVILIIFFGESIVNMWTKNSIKPTFGLLAIYGCWAILEAIGNAFAMFLNGCNIVKPQVVAVCFLCSIAIPLKFILIEKFGVEAMIAGFVMTYLIVFTFFYGIVFNKVLRAKLA